MVQPRNAITFNEEYFKITLTLSNGFIITRKVERKGFNGYEVFDPTNGSILTYNTSEDSLNYIRSLLGMREIRLSARDNKKNVNINFLQQEDGWFYLNMTGPLRAKLLGQVYGTTFADEAIQNYKGKIKDKKDEMKTHKKDLDVHLTNLQSYNDLPDLEKTLQEANIKMKELQELSQKIQQIQSLITSLNALSQQIQHTRQLIAALNINVDAIYQQLLKDNARNEQANKLKSDLDRIKQQGQEARMLTKVLGGLKDISLTDLKMAEDALKDFKLKYEALMKLQSQMNDLQKRIDVIKKQMQELSELSKLEPMLKELQQLQETLKQQQEKTIKALSLNQEITTILKQGKAKRQIVNALTLTVSKEAEIIELVKQKETIKTGSELAKSTIALKNQMQKANQTIQRQKDVIQADVQLYRQKLTEKSECPICHTPINHETIEKIVQDL